MSDVESELADARAEVELLRGLNLLLNRGVVDATAEIERLKASSNRLWEEKIDILGHRDSFESQLSAARAEVERLKARPPGPAMREVLDLIRGCLDVAGVAEVIIGEETARAILAEHEAATKGAGG